MAPTRGAGLVTVFRVPVGSSVSLVDASDPEEARAFVAQELGYRHKPYLVADLEIREATDDEQTLYASLGGKVKKAKIKRDPAEGRNQ